MTQDVRIMQAARLDAALAPFDWVFESENHARIDAWWSEKTRVNPMLYDGPVLLGGRPTLAEGALKLDFFETRFSRFLYHRDFGFPDPLVTNAFSMPALRSADGAFLLGEMGRGHSSAGSVYFPAGTPDLSDVAGDRVDLLGSLMRELREETGVDAREGELAPGWTIVLESGRIACLKIIEHPQPAATLLARVRDFIAREAEPELADAVMISRRDQLDDPRLPLFMRAFLAQALG